MKKNRIALFIFMLLSIITAYFIFTNKAGTIREELRDFAVEDTASIDKIFLADKYGNQVLLERQSPASWIYNGKFPARQDAISLLLVTLKTMEVRSPVAKAAREHIIKDMSARAVKLEVYQKGTLSRVIYVGGATQDQLGTYMYLENSTVPFIMHIPGFDGYLTPRFISNPEEWKVKSVFDFKKGEMVSMMIDNREQPDQSFELKKISDEIYSLHHPGKGELIPYTDTSAILAYLASFQFINFEKPLSGLHKNQVDSVLSAGPFMIITAENNRNNISKAELFRKPVDAGHASSYGADGLVLPYDPDRMIARINGDTSLVFVQYFVFDKLMITLDRLRNAGMKRIR